MNWLRLLKQPKAFYLIALLEFWERYGFYGVQAIAVLFMVKHLGYSDDKADKLFAAYTALAYLLPSLGGYIGDHWLGVRRMIVIGAVVFAIGYGLMAVPHPHYSFVWPLAVIALGNGYFKANPSNLLAKIYHGTDYNVDSGFTLYYMSINIGSFISLTATPIINYYYGWHAAFTVCTFGMIAALITYFSMRHLVKDKGSKPDFKPIQWRYMGLLLLISIVIVIAGHEFLNQYGLDAIVLIVGAIVLVVIYFVFMTKVTPREKSTMLLCFVLIVEATIFFISYFQMPTSLTLFVLRNVNHSIIGIPVLPGSFQALNPFWIFILSPLLAMLYQYLNKKQIDPSIPVKFALGILLIGLSFLVMPFAGWVDAHNGMISSLWVVLSYCLQSAGELLVSALGLAMVSYFVPRKYIGYTMGMWFLCVAIASLVAGKIATFASVPQGITDPVLSLAIYNHVFLELGLYTIGASVIAFLLVPWQKRLAGL